MACWIAACQKARAELGIIGFVAVRKDPGEDFDEIRFKYSPV